MGRRALRKTPNVDLNRHLTKLDELPVPWSAIDLFGRAAPLEVEVGSGKGLFLANAAPARPDVDFLGIEVEGKYAAHTAGKLARDELANARVLHGDAQRFFAEWLPDNSVAAVHVYFPDPWWKKRHRKRRVLNERFLKQVDRVLLVGGILHFWTDVEEYFQTSLEMIAEQTGLAGPFDVPELPPAHDLDYRTHFERRVRQAGEPVYRSEFKKQSAALNAST
jgi:tRNA (guanine-N7-)-methyltransferase